MKILGTSLVPVIMFLFVLGCNNNSEKTDSSDDDVATEKDSADDNDSGEEKDSADNNDSSTSPIGSSKAILPLPFIQLNC